MSEQEKPVFTIEKLYVKNLSLDVPNSPAIYLEKEAPSFEVESNTTGRGLSEGAFEVVLTLAVTAKLADKVAFKVVVAQAGVFQIRNVPDEQLETMVAVGCPNVLFAYAREAISDATLRAGFTPLVLQHVNFEEVYQSRKQKDAGRDAGAGENTIQ